MSRKLVTGKHPVISPDKRGRRKSALELTPDLMDKICKPLLIGLPIATSAALQKVGHATFNSWVNKGFADPDSIYGDFLTACEKNIAEWQLRDLSVIEAHAQGRPAVYEMRVARDSKGDPIKDKEGNVIMEPALDKAGNPIIKSEAIKSDWRAAVARMERRKPNIWANRDNKYDHDNVIDVSKKPVTNDEDDKPLQDMVALAMKQAEDEV